jgi:hypothetical protein
MNPDIEILRLLRDAAAALRARLTQLRRQGDDGYTTETVVVIALRVALAIAAVANIAKANSLDLGLG